MADRSDPASARIPADAMLFAFAPMLPFAAAAAGAWTLPFPWPAFAIVLAILWGGVILVFVAGVRRGFGFGNRGASTKAEIAAMLAYFVPGSLALVLCVAAAIVPALLLLLIGFVLVPLLDVRAAHRGDAPAYFARLRWPQMAIALVSLAVLLARVLIVGD